MSGRTKAKQTMKRIAGITGIAGTTNRTMRWLRMASARKAATRTARFWAMEIHEAMRARWNSGT